ncbi:MAG TPA: hypothetical protein VFD70_27695 [Anaerolineae bacterium]|nr:hypothetical protein [Anaerolineae bacterium]
MSTRGTKSTKQTTRGKRTTSTRKTASTRTRSMRTQARRTPMRSASRANEWSQARATTNHDEIRQWVEARGGYPAMVIGTGANRDDPGVLRIDYPGYSGQDTLERITWDEFFRKFDDADLAFLYQEETKEGAPSRFSKLVDRSQAETMGRS